MLVEVTESEMAQPEDFAGATPVSAGVERRRDLDLIRMFIVVGLVLFHTARVFDTYDWYVKNDQTSEFVTIALSFAAMWGMPLRFVVAGMGIWYSLRSRATHAIDRPLSAAAQLGHAIS